MRAMLCILPLLILDSTSTAISQIHRGSYSLGGTITYSSSKTTQQFFETKTTLFSMSPRISYFLLDEIEITLAPALEDWNIDNSSTLPFYGSSSTGATNIALTLGFRYYYSLEDLALFVGPSGGWGWSKTRGSFSSLRPTYMIEGGLDYFIANTAALEPSVSYSSTEISEATITAVSFGVGVKYFIP